MRYRGVRVWMILACSAGVLLSASRQASQTQAQAAQGKEVKPLVRKDLLANMTKEPAPPLRDIFHPKVSAEPAPPVYRAGRPVFRKSARSAPESPVFTLNLVYVGVVRSGSKTIALIIRDGQTTPVAEGEEIIPGYRVLHITSDALEVEGPKAQKKTFSRQGDWP